MIQNKLFLPEKQVIHGKKVLQITRQKVARPQNFCEKPLEFEANLF